MPQIDEVEPRVLEREELARVAVGSPHREKEVYMRTTWWTLCIITAVLGGSTGVVGLWIMASKQGLTGLCFLILTPFLLAATGIFATLAAKRCEGRKRRIEQWNSTAD